MLSLFFPHLSFFWGLGRTVIRDCGISLVSLLLFFLLCAQCFHVPNMAYHMGHRRPKLEIYNIKTKVISVAICFSCNYAIRY